MPVDLRKFLKGLIFSVTKPKEVISIIIKSSSNNNNNNNNNDNNNNNNNNRNNNNNNDSMLFRSSKEIKHSMYTDFINENQKSWVQALYSYFYEFLSLESSEFLLSAALLGI